MRILILITLMGACLYGRAQGFTCNVPERLTNGTPDAETIARTPDSIDLCAGPHIFEIDYDIVRDKGIVQAEMWARALAKEVEVPFNWIGVYFEFSHRFVESPKYTDGTSLDLLNQIFSRNSIGGDTTFMTLSYKSSGGIAFVDVACKSDNPYRFAFGNVKKDFLRWNEGYSWNPVMIAHEIGHLYGANHTQSCSWNGNNTAIDACVPTGPTCGDAPIPSDGGTIMSYCHLNPVGVNMSKGFHPQVAKVIRAAIYNRCTACYLPPDDEDGDPEPPTITCAQNTVFLHLTLDAYPSETSYNVRDAFGNLVYESQPFNRSQVGEVVGDTLCLADGCYTYTIKDSTGLASVPCLYGRWSVGDPFGEFGSGQDFAGMLDVRFCVGNPLESKCNEVHLDTDSLVSFANQDQVGGVSVHGEGLIKLQGNTWKAQPFEYTVTEQTVLTGRVQIQSVGEIHGIAVVNNIQGLSLRNTIQFGGTQSWGTFFEVEGVESGDWVAIEIPIGQLLPEGQYSHIVLINDHDVPNPTAQTGFRDFEFCEDRDAQLSRTITPFGRVKDESPTVIVEDIILRPHPNPVTNILTLDYDVNWELFTLYGRDINNGYGRYISFAGLPSGFYTLRVGGRTYKIVKG